MFRELSKIWIVEDFSWDEPGTVYEEFEFYGECGLGFPHELDLLSSGDWYRLSSQDVGSGMFGVVLRIMRMRGMSGSSRRHFAALSPDCVLRPVCNVTDCVVATP